MKEAVEKFIAAIEKALPEYEVVDYRTPEHGESFIPFYFNTKGGRINVETYDENYNFDKFEFRLIVRKKWVPKVNEIVAAKSDDRIYYVPFLRHHETGNSMTDDHGRKYDSYRKITEEERKELFPEEDSGLYVLVVEKDSSESNSKSKPIIFEAHAEDSSLDKVRELQKRMNHKYGKTRIARLTFIEDWVWAKYNK